MKTKLTFIATLTAFYNGEKVASIGNSKSQIRHEITWKKLKRVWNDGNGLIDFAIVDPKDNILLINKLFCAPREIKDITANLKVPFEFVELGYPDYYSKGLTEVRK
jgi:hypothetical protein